MPTVIHSAQNQLKFAESRESSALFGSGDCQPSCKQGCDGLHYRYLLRWPTGLDNDLICLGIFANPSTATAEHLDPTLKRWRNYCREWGFGWSYTMNVRAWRSTDPKAVPPDPVAIGPENDDLIREIVSRAALVVGGWGKLGGIRGHVVATMVHSTVKPLHALKLNKDGSPAHPLYLAGNLKPFMIGAELQ